MQPHKQLFLALTAFLFPFCLLAQEQDSLHHAEEEEEIIITSTRSSRTIEDEPTRMEVIAGEEIEEKANMNASNISTMLRETPGLQVQQVSATSFNMTFRIQGLEGRYTQLLMNGMPMYGGFSGGLSLMQISPIDIRQVEIIKGPASTLYGGGAIAGVVNVVTKEPVAARYGAVQLAGTSAKGLDVNAFFSSKKKKISYSVFASRNSQTAFDPNGDGFSDLPQSVRYTVTPSLWWDVSKKLKIEVRLSGVNEDRTGGDMALIDNSLTDSLHQFLEENNSLRFSGQLKVSYALGEKSGLALKHGSGVLSRDVLYSYATNQQIGANLPNFQHFTELTFNYTAPKHELIAGLSFYQDIMPFGDLRPQPNRWTGPQNLGSRSQIPGIFGQDTWEIAEWLHAEAGLRVDFPYMIAYHGEISTKPEVLPRLHLMFRPNGHFTSRLGGGRGYKLPSLYSEQTETIYDSDQLFLSPDSVGVEHSWGLQWDFNYRGLLLGKFPMQLNHLFFWNRISNPNMLAVLFPDPQLPGYQLKAFDGSIQSRGFETNAKLAFGPVKVYGFYTFTDTRRDLNGAVSAIPLTAKHRTGSVIMWEKEESFRVGYEAYWTGKQELSDGTETRSYWTMGFMAEKLWEHFSVYVNAENFTDARMSRWQAMYTGTRANPQFAQEIFAPTDGRILTVGMKLKL